jgi:predicted HTH domain antitoxin
MQAHDTAQPGSALVQARIDLKGRTMAVSFALPTELERSLRSELRDLDAEAKEALLVSLYRQGKLSHIALSKALGLDRFETEDVLRKHNVTEDLGTVEDYLTDAATLAKIRTQSR